MSETSAEFKKKIVELLATEAEDDGFDWDTVDARKAVDNFFSALDAESVEDAAEFIDAIPVRHLGL